MENPLIPQCLEWEGQIQRLHEDWVSKDQVSSLRTVTKSLELIAIEYVPLDAVNKHHIFIQFLWKSSMILMIIFYLAYKIKKQNLN